MTTIINPKGWTRRALLSRFGQASAMTAVAPFLPILEAGASETDPVRFMWFYTGQFPNNINGFFQEANGPTQFPGNGPYAKLNAMADKIAVVAGIDHNCAIDSGGAPHRKGSICGMSGQRLRAARNGELKFYKDATIDGPGYSLDQLIAHDLKARGVNTFYPHLLTGFNQGGHNGERSFSYWNRNVVPLDENPKVVFDRLYKAASGGAGTVDNSLSGKRGSVLDYVYKSVERLNSKVSQADREKIQYHFDSIAALEKRLDTVVESACGAPSEDERFDGDHTRAMQVPAVTDAFFDLIALAFACDLTRVASFQLSRGTDEHNYPWLGPEYAGDFHGWTHGVGGVPGDREKINNAKELVRGAMIWRSEKFLSLMRKFDAVPEGNGSMLDNSGILWWNDVSRAHDYDNMNWILAGSMSGKLKLGERRHHGGVPHNRLLTSLANAMGVATNHVGGPQYGLGRLDALMA